MGHGVPAGGAGDVLPVPAPAVADAVAAEVVGTVADPVAPAGIAAAVVVVVGVGTGQDGHLEGPAAAVGIGVVAAAVGSALVAHVEVVAVAKIQEGNCLGRKNIFMGKSLNLRSAEEELLELPVEHMSPKLRPGPPRR